MKFFSAIAVAAAAVTLALWASDRHYRGLAAIAAVATLAPASVALSRD